MPRLIVVSNRVSVPDPDGPRQAGGLAVAVNAALKQRDGVWFGWSGKVVNGEAASEPRVIRQRRRTVITLDLSAVDFQEYYNGFANRVLWPILHYRVDLAEFSAHELSGYLRVNSLFADALSRFIQPNDTIWVHDYHLLPFAKELRQRGHTNPIGCFIHIPCPPPDILLALPHHDQTVGALSHYDLVGLQTEQDADNLGRYFEAHGAAGRHRSSFAFNSHRVQVGAFPVSIATKVFARAARRAARSPAAEELRDSLGGRRLILGVDRLDYSKGISQRVDAFGRFLDANPEWNGKATFLQVAPKSRSSVPEYEDMERQLSTLVGQINGRHGGASWTPIRYVNRSFPRSTLAAFYRAADVGLVTPLRDGMNLVAKEYVAAQDPEDPGVLVLSQFAGAVAELADGALIVNPHEPEAMAEAILMALEMPLAERKERYRRMFERLAVNDVDHWADRFLTALAAARHRPSLLGGLRQLFAPPTAPTV